ncbi:MAG: hypothetical protein GWN00_39010, partial [Aliifodinibius sp.]|nr:hypothetical protein [Fodinibius sp.]NIV16580.1 hypothetical protein [Fodinibius sp.]NIY30556.1 hypothetical protein [Fodinibius sp.]
MKGIWHHLQTIFFERLVGFQGSMPTPLRRFVLTRQALAIAENFKIVYDIPDKIDVYKIGRPEDAITVLPLRIQEKEEGTTVILTVSSEKFVEILVKRNIHVLHTLTPPPTFGCDMHTVRIFWFHVGNLKI